MRLRGAHALRLGALLLLLLLLGGALLPRLARAEQTRTAADTRAAPDERAAINGPAAIETRAALDGGTPSAHAPPRADSTPGARRPAAAPRSPAAPALTAVAGANGGDEAAASAEASVGEADPLVSNGLGSPSCRDRFGAGELSGGARANCETSGFAAAAAPTGDFGVDVHIDTGVLGLSSGGLLASVQDLCVTPLWMALVWAVHALVVMLEWCFTIDLLDSPSVQLGLARGLREAQAAFTVPWLAAALSVGAVALAYDGLVRRRVGESLGRALLALAMTAGGLWLMIDPVGTVGALSGWANRASLGTLAVSARGSPAQPGATLDGAMRTVFAAVIEGPWCYLEFGDVGWCRDPRQLDPRLHAAALALAAEELTQAGCGGASSAQCASRGSADARALANSVRLLRSARTNGAIFLALPANGSGRNSINDSGSLLRAICQSEDATRCRGPSASEAEFRTNHGTWPRVGGLLLIVAGAVGMLLLLGYLALRLLTAALFGLLYLLLAPLVSLAPALGEGGRALFRRWLEQLVAAVVSKLLFSFVLGATLAVLAILADLEALGWWTQWLLMSAFWWAAFMHRDQALQLVSARGARQRSAARRYAVTRRLGASGARRRVLERVQMAKERRKRHRSEEHAASARRDGSTRERLGTVTANGPAEASSAPLESQARRLFDAEQRDAAIVRAGSAVAREAHATRIGARIERIEREAAVASASGDRRRAVRLVSRGERLQAEARAVRAELDGRQALPEGDRPGFASSARTEREQEHARFLDAQAKLPSAIDAHRTRAATRRDYAALAPLAGHGAREYGRLAPREQRLARLAIDRELAIRRERLLRSADVDRAGAGARVLWHAGRAPRDETVGSEPASGRHEQRAPWRAPKPWRLESSAASESTVMQDAHAVAQRRKRQLGIGRP